MLSHVMGTSTQTKQIPNAEVNVNVNGCVTELNDHGMTSNYGQYINIYL